MNTIGERLIHEHRVLDGLYEEVANRVHCGDTAALDASWSALEARLLAHMDFEESHLLLGFELVAPAEAARVAEEHRQIRRVLGEVGIAIELHTVREDHVEEFLSLLRAHAAREEGLLYPWASAPVGITPEATPERNLTPPPTPALRGDAAQAATVGPVRAVSGTRRAHDGN